MTKRSVVFLPAILRDIDDVLLWSETTFGVAAALRYELLIRHALRYLQEDATSHASRARPDLAADAHTYHLRSSRRHVLPPSVRNPRHLVLYRLSPGVIQLARLLHDSRDLARHLQEP